MNKQPSHYKICIIGGGVAGLTAANTLAENGQNDFIILEASERIGGRVCSDKERGIELGGEFVHGEGSILWDVLANKLKIPLKVVFDYSAPNPKDCGLGFLLNGKIYEINHPVAQKTLEILEQLTTDEELKKSKDMSLKEWLEWRNIPKEFHTLIDSILAQTNSSCINTHSAKGAQEEELSGEDTNIGELNFHVEGANTMDLIIPYLTRLVNMEKQLKLNYFVHSIDYSDKNVIKLNNGEITCEKVILAVPLTILRNRQIKFTPDLSPQKKHLLQNQFHMHGGMKILLRYKRPVWKEQMPNVNVVVVGDEDPIIAQYWFSSTSDEQCKKYGHIITGFSMSRKADNALHMTDEEIKQHFRKFIQKTYHLNDDNDGYLGGDVRNWQHIHHVAGAYSFALTTDASKIHYIEQPRVVLSQPIGSKIYFAGEAYCQHSPATIHGAMETGQKAALDVLQSLTSPSSVPRGHSRMSKL
ncbi:hypothetical protein C9374_005233 [Naegleria lovaniensis]|uniref:Amine oxidase n=1 Tax=Naegleria lovaniensis TaxID=51637 RepID=A0AA88KK78_NAELO|nr:uncharacterized protein C9374_005233 [Naegleria lovaniensis]KAG2382653.1 hypothetical protein C9374_005233 [Naegleria lovaniensis]